MRATSRLQKLNARLRSFATNRDGSIVILFALLLLPMVGLVGAGIDYSRANAARTAMQAALDSTALMLSKEASGLTQSQLDSKAKTYFNAMFTRPGVLNVTLDPAKYTPTPTQLVLAAKGTVSSTFMAMVNMPIMSIGTSSTITWGSTRLRIALALDNTGSMNEVGKLTALKTATKDLLKQLKNAAPTSGDVYVSVIPFTTHINEGASNYGKTWLDWEDWDARNGSCSHKSYDTKSACLYHRRTWTPDAHNTWNGCVMDRDKDYDVKNTTPVATSTLFPADEAGSSCPVQLLPQTYDWTALDSKVDAMVGSGATNTTIGLVWGWQSLTEGLPLNPPAIVNDGIATQKILILLTDGENTDNRWSDSTSGINLRMKLACKNAKDAGITIWTVLLMEGNESLLKECASPADQYGAKYIKVTAASGIGKAFETIGTSLTKMRVAK